MAFELPPYRKWEKRFRELTDSGMDVLDAWHKTHKEFGMAKNQVAEYEKRVGRTL